MKKLKLTSLFAAFTLLLAGCGNQSASSSASKADESSAAVAAASGKTLVTLGDSISYGFGLDQYDTERYSALLTSKLEQADNCKWNDCNYAVSGDDSSDLLKRIDTGKTLRLPSADTIVVCIGANNLLGVMMEYAQEKADEYGITEETLNSATDSELAALQADLGEKLKDSETIKKEITAKIDANLERLTKDLDGMYDRIHERNSKADIYLMNIYNPYRGTSDPFGGMGFSLGDDFGSYAQEQIDRCNGILTDFANKHDEITMVDIASVFAKTDPIPIIGATDVQGLTGSSDESTTSEKLGQMKYVDPHPNAEGQKLIADTLFAAMRGKS